MSSDEDESDENGSEVDEDIDEYCGYLPPPGVTLLTERISNDISPEEFFIQFITARKPVVISGFPCDSCWKANNWTNSYLCQVAGDAAVLVEDRKDIKTSSLLSFGYYAPKIRMKYGDVVRAVMDRESRYYLTTQDVERFECDEDGLAKSVMAEPLKHLQSDFAVQPVLLGNLVPHLISLWQGFTTDSTSTGLHHDFHDNLYVLIRGRKRFRLFPPSDAPLLRLTGRPTKIHPNGLIVYPLQGTRKSHGIVSVRADGAPMAVLARKNRDKAERDLLEAEEQLAKLEQMENGREAVECERAREHVAECEQRLDDALEQLLMYDDDDDDDDDDEVNEPPTKRDKLADGDKVAATTDSSSLLEHFCDVTLPPEDTTDSQVLLCCLQDGSVATETVPPVTAPPVTAPAIRSMPRCHIVELQAGEMLYLPASWFHEVTSYNAPTSQAAQHSTEDIEQRDTAGHLALNYWMYPPDNNVFQQPYISQYWPQRWADMH